MIKALLKKIAKHERGAHWTDWSHECGFKDHVFGGIIVPAERWKLFGFVIDRKKDSFLYPSGMTYKNPVDYIERVVDLGNMGYSRPKDVRGEVFEQHQRRLAMSSHAETDLHDSRTHD